MVVSPNVRSTINTLEAADAAGVQRYVLSSSSKAVETTRYDDIPRCLTAGMYNWDCLLKTSCGPRHDAFDWLLDVYSAGRTIAEIAFWSWIAENRPSFVANCVVPDGNFGRGLNGATSSNQMLKAALAGQWDAVPMPLGKLFLMSATVQRHWNLIIHFLEVSGFLCDVEDTARLLVAATAKSSLSNERIFAYYKHLTWDDLRQKVRGIRPELVKGDDQHLQGRYLSSATDEVNRAEGILRDVGQPGFTSEDSMLQKFLRTCF